MRPDKEIITSPQNQYVSLVRGLTNRKKREKDSLFRFDGVKLMCEAIKKGVKISFALVDEASWESVLEKAGRLYGISDAQIDFKVVFVSERVFSSVSEESSPEGIICIAEFIPSIRDLDDPSAVSGIPNGEKILLLESVRDPLNVGAIIRASAAFGVDRLILSSDCADVYNSKVIRASMGNLFGVCVDRVPDMPCAVKALRQNGRRVFAAALERDAYRLGELEIRDGDCVIIGNEGHGLDKNTIDACDGTVYIPMADGVESLNAATAAAVLSWEFFGALRR